jgi:hypothetical protein
MLMVLNLGVVYCYTGTVKNGAVWAKGDALYYALNMDHFHRFYPQELSSILGPERVPPGHVDHALVGGPVPADGRRHDHPLGHPRAAEAAARLAAVGHARVLARPRGQCDGVCLVTARSTRRPAGPSAARRSCGFARLAGRS